MTSFLDKNGLQRYHNDIKEGLNEVVIQEEEPTTGKLWFDGNFVIDPDDFDAEKQEVVVSNIPPEPDDHHKLWIQPREGGEEELYMDILDLVYPPGTFYENANMSFNPNGFFVGEWERASNNKWYRKS